MYCFILISWVNTSKPEKNNWGLHPKNPDHSVLPPFLQQVFWATRMLLSKTDCALVQKAKDMDPGPKTPTIPSQTDSFYPNLLMGKVHVTCCPLSDTHTFSRVVVVVGEGQSYAWKCAKTVKVSATAEGYISMSSDPVLIASVRKARWPLSKLAVILVGFPICNSLLCHLCDTPSVHTPFTPPFYLSWLLCV